MSKSFLYELNGTKRGRFKEFLDNFNGEPRICWYPSAGHDFRPLFYLHEAYGRINPPVSVQDPPAPDLFIFTDYYPYENSVFFDRPLIYSDNNASVIASHIEELPRLHLRLHKELVVFHEGSIATDRAIFLEISASSNSEIGSFKVPVLYLFAMNEAFYCHKLRPSKAVISHVIHVRYGGGFGGARASGAWILNVLKDLKCEVFINDDHNPWRSGDEFMLSYCEEMPKVSEAELTPYRVLPERNWSNHGDVVWNLVK